MESVPHSNLFLHRAGRGFKTAFRSLGYRNYRLFFSGQAVSLIGTWMQQVAVSWLAYRLTGSSLILGTVAFCAQVPVFVLSPFTGALGDRLDRRKILFTVQILSMMQAFVLFLLTVTGVVLPWHIIVLMLVLGVINSFEMPTRQAFLLEMVDDKRDLPNAIALNSAAFNSSRLIGPAFAGIVVALWGEAVCFAINSASYLASASAFLLMHLRPAPGFERKSLLADIREGFRYIMDFRFIRNLLFIVAFVSFFSMIFPVLLPVLASEVLKGDSHTFGFLVSSVGAGALTATMFLAVRNSIKGLVNIINVCMFVSGVMFLLLARPVSLAVAMLLLAVTGFCMIVIMASCNTILQTVSDEEKRGRVISFYIMSFTGAAPLGSLAAGYMSHRLGVPYTFLISGIICILAGVAISLKLRMKRE